MHDSSVRVLYRLVTTNPSTVSDFQLNAALGHRPRRPLRPRERDLWEGVSHYDTPEAAISVSKASPWQGTYLATLHIPVEVGVRIEQTGRSLAHHTVWAEPAELLQWLVAVVPVGEVH